MRDRRETLSVILQAPIRNRRRPGVAECRKAFVIRPRAWVKEIMAGPARARAPQFFVSAAPPCKGREEL